MVNALYKPVGSRKWLELVQNADGENRGEQHFESVDPLLSFCEHYPSSDVRDAFGPDGGQFPARGTIGSGGPPHWQAGVARGAQTAIERGHKSVDGFRVFR
jgi:hypothetical protein